MAAQGRDRDAIVGRQLVERRQEFFRFFRRRLSCLEDAEDALQDFCIKAIRSANTLEDSAKVDAWLRRIQRSILIDYYRSRATRAKAAAAYAREPLYEASPDLETEPVACSYIHDLLPLLRPDYAEIIRRIDLEEIPRQRVATELGLTSNNVGVRLHRAHRALRLEIERRCQRLHDGECEISSSDEIRMCELMPEVGRVISTTFEDRHQWLSERCTDRQINRRMERI